MPEVIEIAVHFDISRGETAAIQQFQWPLPSLHRGIGRDLLRTVGINHQA